MSVDDVGDVLTLCFESINGRRTEAFQSSDIFGLVSQNNFDHFTDALYHFYCTILSVPDLGDQGSNLERWLQYLGLDIPYQSIPERLNLIYELVIEILGERLRHGKCGTRATLNTDSGVTRNGCLALAIENDACNALKLLGDGVGIRSQVDEFLKAGEVLSGNEQRLADFLEANAPTFFQCWEKRKAESFDYLLFPNFECRSEKEQIRLGNLLKNLNDEYKKRMSVMMTRLEVTSQAFLWSPKAKDLMEELSGPLSKVMILTEEIQKIPILTYWELRGAIKPLLKPVKSYTQSAVKKVQIGDVPNRGGVPEGFALSDVTKDVGKANQDLQRKDQPRAAPKSQPKPSSQQWIGGDSPATTAGISPERKRVWNVSATSPEGQMASRRARFAGGAYRGVTGGYDACGRRRFPGMDQMGYQDCTNSAKDNVPTRQVVMDTSQRWGR